MPPSPHNPTRPIDRAARELLEGLATVHDLVVAIDDENELAFLSDPDGRLGAPPPTKCDGLTQTVLGRGLIEALERSGRARERGDEIEAAGDWRVFPSAVAASRPLRVALLANVPSPLAAASTEKNDALAAQNDELETCLRSVSHDLRSPLVSVLGFTRLLREDFGESIGRTGQHFVDRIEQAGKQMERLLHDLLELTRISDTPQVPVHVQPMAVLEQVAAELKLRLEAAHVELVLPETAPILVCDRTRLYQLFSNLIGNAIAHMHRETGGRITVRIEEDGAGWQIDVADNGPGISDADREAIFEPFRTGRTAPATVPPSRSTPRKKSSGLGLAIVRKIVETHGGRIWIEGEPGEGACFRVRLDRPTPPETGSRATP